MTTEVSRVAVSTARASALRVAKLAEQPLLKSLPARRYSQT
jgi:hypothetical protein